ncbi:MAG: hypothetical protein LKG27_03860 [Clostridiaceae bacterium]|jgi:hypothetical protein|nr:hypothetical protein [Clostridiaceae bacterium]
MTNKCTKYQGLFIFADEKTFLSHVDSCDECKAEHEKMERVSALIQEVKPLYRQNKSRTKALKAACVMFALFVFGVSFTALDSKFSIMDTLKYGQAVSLEDMGFPVDSYGLLMVE